VTPGLTSMPTDQAPSGPSAPPVLRPLLFDDEPAAFEVVNAAGRGTAVLTCDHASWRLPRALGTLGLDDDARRDHIGWDPGAAEVARRLSRLLDAPLVLSGYSRLAIDCNRPPGEATSIPAVTGGVRVPGNEALGEGDRAERAEALFWPYQRALGALLDERRARGAPTAVLAIHSFTPSLQGEVRPWHGAMLYGKDRRLAGWFLEELSRERGLVLGDNEPYQVTDGGDYTVPVHAERRGLLGVRIEVRNDQLRDEAGQDAWAGRLARAYGAIEGRILAAGGP
jgi:predicted N-formylglutamate amidohydrolase